ncbi:MAG TPA: hypothetical protein VFA33_07640 [Bryobacteraceae bacterium]|nr:hypothetical protein [Bryobacteraceae bacterium]
MTREEWMASVRAAERQDQLRDLRELGLVALVLVGAALVFRWHGFDWWWYWPLHLGVQILGEALEN